MGSVATAPHGLESISAVMLNHVHRSPGLQPPVRPPAWGVSYRHPSFSPVKHHSRPGERKARVDPFGGRNYRGKGRVTGGEERLLPPHVKLWRGDLPPGWPARGPGFLLRRGLSIPRPASPHPAPAALRPHLAPSGRS